MKRLSAPHGFSLLETVIACGIFAIFVLGLYASLNFSFSLVYQSRVRIIATGILNEQMELMRNVAFEDVGIINGSPPGVFAHTEIVERNNIPFEITRTIRYIDDPFDGLATGTEPIDLSPNDYKFVQIEAVCVTCNQNQPFSMYTLIAPKYLEGNPNNGAVFIRVIDSFGNAIENASVHVVASSTIHTFDFVDTTDNNGYLRLYDLPSSEVEYAVSVSKNGYTTDTTMVPSLDNPNPVTPPLVVVAQSVVSRTFMIDQESSLSLYTRDSECTAISSVPFKLRGTRLVGTEPDVYLADINDTTDTSGNRILTGMYWDNYGFDVVSGYDFGGVIPINPFFLPPNRFRTTTLITYPDTSLSLVITATSQQNIPIGGASVSLLGPDDFSTTTTTQFAGLYYKNWTDGEGTNFAGGLETLENIWIQSGESGELMLIGASGFVESVMYDMGENVRYWTTFAKVSDDHVAQVRIQIATSVTSTPESWNFVGPDGTNNTYYTSEIVDINASHAGERYMKYRIYVETSDTNVYPIVSSFGIIATDMCLPPGQVYIGNLQTGDYTLTMEADGFQLYEDSFTLSDPIVVHASMSP